jgi:5-methylcytosine-specific restriction protein A
MENLLETLDSEFFPTSKFDNDFNNPDFIRLKEKLSIAADELAIQFPAESYSRSINTGKGRIAGIPWIGFHSRSQQFNSSSTTGIYVAILWHFDGKGITLSLQKGTDESPAAEVKGAVEAIRKRHGIKDFSGDIVLGAPVGPGRPRNYETANIVGLTYSAETISNLEIGLQKIENYYSNLVEERLDCLKVLGRTESEEINYQSPPKLRKNEATSTWVRDPKIRDASLNKSGFKCEGDNSHITFQVGGNNFMEGHHLIPLEFQSQFPNKSLDFIDNVFSLCPNCHRRIHYSERSDRLSLVRRLYELRQDKFKIYLQDCDISLELVLSFYESS